MFWKTERGVLKQQTSTLGQLFVVCLFVFLALQPIVVVFSQPVADFSLLMF
jgi:hypothetical protein